MSIFNGLKTIKLVAWTCFIFLFIFEWLHINALVLVYSFILRDLTTESSCVMANN